jgi:hypothetical protein
MRPLAAHENGRTPESRRPPVGEVGEAQEVFRLRQWQPAAYSRMNAATSAKVSCSSSE